MIQALAGSVVELDNLLTIERGLLAGLDGGVIRSVGGGLTGTTLDNSTIVGRYEIAEISATTIKGTLSNTGQIVFGSPTGSGRSDLQWTSEAFLQGGGEVLVSDSNLHRLRPLAGVSERLENKDNTIRGAGQILGNVTNRGAVRAENGLLIIDPADNGSFLNLGQLTSSSAGDIEMRFGGFENAGGEVLVAEGSAFVRMGSYVQTSGSTMVDGTLVVQNGVIDIQGGTFGGSGQVVGDLTVGGALVSPGNTPGELRIDGKFTTGQDSILEIEIGSQFDVLTATGDASLGGTLRVVRLPESAHAAGTEFTFLSAANILDGFTDFDMPVDQAGDPYLSLSQVDGTLKLTARTAIPLLGDFDLDGQLATDDIDLLSSAVRASSVNTFFDLNRDRAVNQADRAHWLDLSATLLGRPCHPWESSVITATAETAWNTDPRPSI